MTDTFAKPRPDAWRADAMRYRMLWRLVPSMSHKLAGAMQPVSMLAALVARHLQHSQPDIQALSGQVANLQEACKAAITARTDVMAWFQPSETKSVSIADELTQCTRLLTAEFAMRGCSVDNRLADAQGATLQINLRTVFMASLFAILDNAEGPVEVQLRCMPASSGSATIVVSWNPLAASDISPHSNGRHTIGWDDLQAVADQLGVGLERTSAQIDLFFTLAA